MKYLIGGDIVEFISKNSNIFKMVNNKNEDNKSFRVILPDSSLSELLCKHMMYANQKLPKVEKPND
jgi:hypothetical protein